MSEFFDTPLSRDNGNEVRVELQQKQKKEEKFIGRKRHVPGHIMFSYNIQTGEIKVAPMRCLCYLDAKTRQPYRVRKIMVERNYIYREALNKKNFVKKIIHEGILRLKKAPQPNKQ